MPARSRPSASSTPRAHRSPSPGRDRCARTTANSRSRSSKGFVSQNVSGIVIAPLDERALVRPIEEAKRAGIPTIVIDSGLDTKEIVSFVATDNIKGGELAADRMGELLKGRGKVLLLRYQEGSASTTERETGFLSRLKAKFPGITRDLVRSIRGPDPRHREARVGESAEPLRLRAAGRILRQRVVDARHAAGAPGHQQGRADRLHRVRRQPDVHRRARERAAPRPGRAESDEHGLPGRHRRWWRPCAASRWKAGSTPACG